ncbi:hypothetical protein JCM5353_001301 [Sporobolomyces roseus]
MGHGKVTQLALTWSILAFDSILIVMLTLFACVNRPRGRPLWIKRVKKPTIETLVKASSSHPSTGAPPSRSNDGSQPPPGSSSIESDLASLVNGNGKSSKGFTVFLAKHSRSFEFVLIGSLFVAVVVVWGILDLRVRGTANPDPPSPKPSTFIENLAWGLAFGAVPLWVGPRIVNIVVSLKDGVPEGITTAAVCLGGSSHICNIASVLMINNTADSRRAESPFIATAVACVFFDTIRLALKYYITRRQGSATKPERDPHWLEKQEDFKYDNKSKGLHRYGTPRIDMPLDSKRLSFSDSQSSAEESSSSQGALESHQKLLARTALLPLPGRKRDDPNLSANVTFLEEQNRRRKLKQNKDYPPEEAPSYDTATFETSMKRVNELIEKRIGTIAELPVTSTKAAIENALRELPESLPKAGAGLESVTNLLLKTISPALFPAQSGPRCFGLVTGGVTPASQLAETIVTSFDPCVQEATISTAIESLTLDYLLDLLSLPKNAFSQNTLTTGATSSNLLGLALGRNYAISTVKSRQGIFDWSVTEDGLGGVDVDIFCVDAHNSIRKSASLAGMGRRNVHDLGSKTLEDEGYLCCFDLEKLEERLKANVENGRGSIVVTSFGEVNTGAICSDTPAVRKLCDQYSAWLHCDAAFAAFAVLHPDFEHYGAHLALADSITSDAHKWLNVPYDCGLFFSRQRQIPHSDTVVSLFDLTGPGQASVSYVSASNATAQSDHPLLDKSRSLPNPLFMNIENSRRFRALPLYASLLSLGIDGYRSLVQRNVAFARQVDTFLRSHSKYDVLTPTPDYSPNSNPLSFKVLNIVIFAPSSSAPARYREFTEDNPDPAATFLASLNSTNEIFVTGTTWRGRKAVRIAVSNWMTDEGRDLAIVKGVLDRVMQE